MKDYYKILGISPSANTLEIRKAYRRLALQLHPDENKSVSAKDEFILVNEAYEVLKNALSRKRYDTLYDHEVLHKTPKSEDRFQKRKTKREDAISDRAKAGKRKGEKKSKKDKSRHKKKQKRSGFWDFLSIFGDFAELILAFFQ